MESGQYRVILADPPWDFSAWNPKTASRHVSRQYAPMTVGQIVALPAAALAMDDAALFLWATWPNIEAAFDVIRAWGFTYRTLAWEWIKTTKSGKPALGMGYYTRSNPEPCLLAVRGRMRVRAHDVSSVLLAPRREHSRKPDEQYERIMRLFDGPYVELFARQQWPGFDVWGNQAGKFPAQPFLFGEQVS